MIEVSDEQFQDFITEAYEQLPKGHLEHLQNVAFLYEDEPTDEQRVKLQLRHDQSLFGLYEGVPLAFRQGQTHIYPDRITLFKKPILAHSATLADVKEQVKHTMWHEVAHYFGLDHDRIHELEQ